MIKRESNWKLLNTVLVIYVVYAVVRMICYGQGTLHSIVFDLGRIVLLLILLWWVNSRRKRKLGFWGIRNADEV